MPECDSPYNFDGSLGFNAEGFADAEGPAVNLDIFADYGTGTISITESLMPEKARWLADCLRKAADEAEERMRRLIIEDGE